MMVLVALLMVALLGMAGLTMDAGKLLLTYRTLQATTDDAALAGAVTLPANNATTVATQYSSATGNKNARAFLSGATMVSGYPVVKCLSSLQNQGYACTSPANGNAVQVKQQVTVATPFMRVLGYSQMTMAAVSTARSGLVVDLGTGVSSYFVYVSPNNQYNGNVVNTNNANLPYGWNTPASSGYTEANVAWVIPPGGNGDPSASYPVGNYVYVSSAVTGITSILQGMVNSDDDVSVALYDLTSGSPVQVGSTYSSSGGNGSWNHSPMYFSYSGLSVTHSYRLTGTVYNSNGATGLMMQAIGFNPVALYQ